MPHWMTHEKHGVTAAYDNGEKSRLQSAGWQFLNSGESPNLPPKTPAAPITAPDSATKTMPPDDPEMQVPDEPKDILDAPVVQILPQLPGMSRAQLEAVRAREAGGRARKGLLKTLADLIEAKD